MRIENSVDVAAAPEKVWEYLLDLKRVTPCMPGAELEELIDERTWKGKMKVKVGPVSLAYAATVVVEERDDENRVVTLKANARETKGKGTGKATVKARVEPHGEGGSRIEIVSDLTVAGVVAQYGRGIIAKVSNRLAAEFAACLGASLAAPSSNGAV